MRTYADLCVIAEATTPIDPGDTSVQLSPHDALLQQLGIIVIGEHEGMQRIEIYCTETRKSATLYDIDKLTVPKLTQLIGNDRVEQHVHDGNKAPAGQVLIKDVRLAIASAASGKVFMQERKLGAGVHEIDKQIVLIKAQERGIVNCQAIEKSGEPFIGQHMLDLGMSSRDWCDMGSLERYLAAAQDRSWRMQVFDEMEGIFAKWYWRYISSPTIVTSLAICTWLQSLWQFRPEIAITGDSSSGKSYLMGRVLKELGGKLSLYTMKGSEAAIRNHVKHHSLWILIDEFETDKHRQGVLELFRGSGSGTEVIRGTRDQRGMSFVMRHIPWFGSIETGLHKQQDQNRFIILELKKIPKEMENRIVLPTPEYLNDLGQKLLAVGLACQAEARRLDQHLRTEHAEGVPGRLVELFSVPCSMISAVYGHNVEQALEFQAGVLATWDFASQRSENATGLLAEILATEVNFEGGKRATISQLLRLAGGKMVSVEEDEALHRAGISRVTKKNTHNRYIFFNCDHIRKAILRPSSDFYGQSVDQYLLRVEGAIRDRHRLGGSERFVGVSVPVETLDQLFDSGELGSDAQD